MRFVAATLAVLAFFIPPAAWPVSGEELPRNLVAFLKARELCEHWRGEPGYDKERQAQIDRAICMNCAGTDAKMRALKQRYQANRLESARLGELGEGVESAGTAATDQSCSAVRQPQQEAPR